MSYPDNFTTAAYDRAWTGQDVFPGQFDTSRITRAITELRAALDEAEKYGPAFVAEEAGKRLDQMDEWADIAVLAQGEG